MAEQLQLPLERVTLIECGARANHHLRRKKSGLWQMRVTIDQGPRYVGRRVVIGLGTKDLRKARKRRDKIILVLRQAGKIR